MDNEAFALKISSAIDQQQYDKAADQVEALRPIDIADILALINPSSAWQLL
ncbi:MULTISPECIES: hypothetical protein [unclassified Psychrobacter]|jgi:magnesium transporter|uniref:hypothetical protein n=1 Tax=unclassified Psychrobacter TaxID=196806 RepID=UPI00041B38D6|nr:MULTISPECIES: hypothetical protein [unclassified Psychrobacter]